MISKQEQQQLQQHISKKVLRKVFWRSIPMEHSWNYERMMNLGYCYAMIPALKVLYKDDEEKLKEALLRHMEFYNTTPYIITLPLGISVAMEEKYAENPDLMDATAISSVKAALMGPLAGIGDSIFWGTLRIIATGVGTTLAVQGNILGPILFFLIFNLPNLGLRYWLTFIGYRFGADVLSNVEKSGIMEKLTYGASIVGLLVAGAMTAENVYVQVAGKIGVGDDATTIQEILDGIIPGLLPLGIMGITYYFLRKKVKPLTLMFIMMGVCILCAWLGIFVPVEE